MKKACILFLIIIGLFAFLLPARAQTPSVVIIGDSITQGFIPHYTFRQPLWENLIRAGADFDFVGSTVLPANNRMLSHPRCNCVIFDQEHEGHAGYRADQIATSLPTWLADYTPDVAVIHIGTNDIMQSQTVASTEDDIDDIIDALQADNANITILLAQIIPTTNATYHADIDTLNADLPALAAAQTTATSTVTAVDCHTGFDAATDTYDGTHPDESGEQKIANAFFAALDGILY